MYTDSRNMYTFPVRSDAPSIIYRARFLTMQLPSRRILSINYVRAVVIFGIMGAC